MALTACEAGDVELGEVTPFDNDGLAGPGSIIGAIMSLARARWGAADGVEGY